MSNLTETQQLTLQTIGGACFGRGAKGYLNDAETGNFDLDGRTISGLTSKGLITVVETRTGRGGAQKRRAIRVTKEGRALLQAA